ncbi:NADP-dependent oxidoreductase [Caldifermentibacillus hisashii]|uniref:NADP-dependent oxidoreductase n=1 Tax=Caldifermentibacillus hisashii TaxID=996558 RepID=UPI0031B68B7E
MKNENRRIILGSRPSGMPTKENFQIVTEAIPEIKEGEILIQTIFLSVDPYMRGRMTGIKTYVDPFEVGKVLTGGVVGKIVESKHSNFQEGDIVEGQLDWADYSVSNERHIRKVDPNLAPISTALGVIGMPGLTAYFGLLDIGKPKEGETVVISGAAGAVGMVVGQIAKLKGCHVVGIAGSQEKIAYLKEELGFDAVINYKTDQIKQALKTACPNGIDVYFDNVGGEISDLVLRFMNFHSRIVLCGDISQYNNEKIEYGPRFQSLLVTRSILMQGFIVSNYSKRFAEGYRDLAKWVSEGKLKYRETIIDGLENAPDAFIDLFYGKNIGKQLVRVSNE